MLVDNLPKLPGLKAGHVLEVRKQGADLLLEPQEPKTEETDFSKLLAQELPEDEVQKPADPAAPLPTADAAPAPVQVLPDALQGAQYLRTLGAPVVVSERGRLAQSSENYGLSPLTTAGSEKQSALSEATQDRLVPNRSGSKSNSYDKQRQAEEFDVVKPPTSWLQEEAGQINVLPMNVLTSGERLPQVMAESQAVKPVAYSFQSAEVTRDISMTGGSVGIPDAPLVADASQATEKASYWAANGTQNLALTLEGRGEESVSIKISLTGQETHVDIRTDHVALRQMIEGTVQVIKEQFSSEGLSLSGVSVGSGHQGQSMDQGRNGQSRMAAREFDYKNMAVNKVTAPLLHTVLPNAARKLSIFV